MDHMRPALVAAMALIGGMSYAQMHQKKSGPYPESGFPGGKGRYRETNWRDERAFQNRVAKRRAHNKAARRMRKRSA